MPSITIRNMDIALRKRLRARAAENGRSPEDEALSILEAALGAKTSMSPFSMVKQFQARFGGSGERPAAPPAKDSPGSE